MENWLKCAEKSKQVLEMSWKGGKNYNMLQEMWKIAETSRFSRFMFGEMSRLTHIP